MATITGNASKKARATLNGLERQWKDNGGTGPFVPETGTKEDYDKLVAAVDQATAKNENIAALRTRIKGLGDSVVSLANTLKVI